MKTKLMLIAVIVSFPVLAFAQDAAPVVVTQEWWQALMVTIIETILAVATPVLVVLVGALLKKWRINAEQDKLEWIVAKAVGFGEQAAKKALKDGKPIAGPDILKLALEKGEGWLTQAGLAKKWGDQLADLVEAKLGQHYIEQPKV